MAEQQAQSAAIGAGDPGEQGAGALGAGEGAPLPRVHLEPSGRRLEVALRESVLEAALRQGVALPYGCRNGACRSCRARILEGEVHYPGGPPKALLPLDHTQGFVLLCAAHLRADARIEVEEIDSHRDIVVRTLPCRLVEKELLAHDVIALRLRLQEGERLHFLAGQYVDVVLRDGRRRAFSLANPPAGAALYELQIRRVPGGEFSAYVFDHVKPRAILRMHGPLGSFYLRKGDARPVVLMAGGTGFAPIKSIIEDALLEGHAHPMHLYWGVRARRDLYHDALARRWAREHGNFHYTPVLSEPGADDGWRGRTGLVHHALLEDFPDLSGWGAYMSGPPPMVGAARRSLVEQGLDPAFLHSDSFDHAFETGHDAP